MHLLILPSWYFPFGSQAIAGRMFHHLASGLRENEIDARILYSNYTCPGPILKKEKKNVEDGVPTWRYHQMYPPKVNKLFLRLWQKKCAADIQSYIEKEGKPDLIHAHSYLAASVSAAVQKKIRIPFVYTERLSGFMTDDIPNYHLPLISEVCEAADRLTAVSPGMANCMQKFANQSFQVVPNFYDPKVFYPDPTQTKFDVFTWLSVGEPANIKGLDILLNAFAEMKRRMRDTPMQLILVDNIPQKQELLQHAQSLHIDKEIVWKGLISQDELAAVINKSHVFVSASRVETFGKAIVEAQACGLPVVVTKTEGAKYIVTSDSQGEIAEPGDANSLMMAMQKVIENYPSYHSNTISAIVARRFSQTIVLQQWISLYNSLLI